MTRTNHSRWAFAIGVVLLAVLAGTRAQAQDEQKKPEAEAEIDRAPMDCVLLNRVSRNVAANDHQVVFFMRGGTYYRNDLDAACGALTAGETRLVFHYETRSAKVVRICKTDAFTVERQASRLGCGLGEFTPITAAEVEALTGKPVAAPAASDSGSRNRRN